MPSKPCTQRASNCHDPGLERTDNGMKQTNWPEVTPINQKNYYTYALPATATCVRANFSPRS